MSPQTDSAVDCDNDAEKVAEPTTSAEKPSEEEHVDALKQELSGDKEVEQGDRIYLLQALYRRYLLHIIVIFTYIFVLVLSGIHFGVS